MYAFTPDFDGIFKSLTAFEIILIHEIGQPWSPAWFDVSVIQQLLDKVTFEAVEKLVIIGVILANLLASRRLRHECALDFAHLQVCHRALGIIDADTIRSESPRKQSKDQEYLLSGFVKKNVHVRSSISVDVYQ